MSLLIRKVTVIDPRSVFHNMTVDILWDQGAIQAIAPALSHDNSSTLLEGHNLCISPGWIDIFADYREPGFEQKETIRTGMDAAAAGGFTHVFLSPNTNPPVSSKSTVQYLLRQAAGHAVVIHPLGAVTQNTEGKSLAEMWDMHVNGAIAFTDGWKPVQHAGLMLKALEYVKAWRGMLIQIPIDTALAIGGLMHEGLLSTKLGMPGIPVLAETIFLHRDLELLRYTGSRLHVTGISTAAGVALIREAKKEGLDITCSVTPYHLALTDEALQHYDSLYKVMPVLRSEADRQALIMALADGTIDCIASHHKPQDTDAKAKEFEYAGDGMNLQETAFSIILEATEGKVSLERLIDALAIRPASLFGLEAEKIAVGYTSGLTIFMVGNTRMFTEDQVLSASRNNPYIGTQLKGAVAGILNNQKIHLNKY